MFKNLSYFYLLIVFVLAGCSSVNHRQIVEEASWPKPSRYEKAIVAFEEQDEAAPTPEQAIVAVGSSSMRGWHKHIAEDLAPHVIIPRGFGGSNMHDVLYYTDRVVTKYNPKAVLLYEGDNDVASGVSAELVRSAYISFFEEVWKANPKTRIYVLSIKPSPSRWKHWPEMKRANELLMKECKRDKRLIYIDVATPMLAENGEPKADIFLNDDLHMNRKGYEIWRSAVLPVLNEYE